MVIKLGNSRKSNLIFFVTLVAVLGIIFIILLSSRLSKPENVSPTQGEASVIHDEKFKYLYAVQSVLNKDGSSGWMQTCLINEFSDKLQDVFQECSKWEMSDFLTSSSIPVKVDQFGKEVQVVEFGGYDAIPFVDSTGLIQKVRQVLIDNEKVKENGLEKDDLYFWTRVCNIDNSGDYKYGVKDLDNDCENWSKPKKVSEIGLLSQDLSFKAVVDFAAHDFTYQGGQKAFFSVLSLENSNYSLIEQMTGKYFESSEFSEIDNKMHGGEGGYWLPFPGLYSGHSSFMYIYKDPSGNKFEKVVEQVISSGGTRMYGRVCDIDNTQGGAVDGCEWIDAGVLDLGEEGSMEAESFKGLGAYTFTTSKPINLNN